MHDAATRHDEVGCGFLSTREIDAALSGGLDAARRDAFEAHAVECDACALLAADLDTFRRVAEDGPIFAERAAFERAAPVARAGLRRALDETAPRRGFRWLGLMPSLAMAGAAAVLVALFAVPWGDRLPAGIVLADGTLLAPEPPAWSAPPVVRGAGAGPWDRAGAAYRDRDWDGVAEALAGVERGDPGEIDAPLYRGVALTMDGRYAAAAAELRTAIERGDAVGATGSTARYWLGVALLGAGDADGARDALAAAAADGGAGGRRAAELLEELDGR